MLVEATQLDHLTIVGRVAGGAALGLLIGFEREVDGHEAGARTHLLLALGAALFGAVSVGAFHDFTTEGVTTNVTVEVSRIASYVAAGSGFLGGGAILKRRDGVKGLTTAASLWTAAAAGLAAGLGFWTGAVATTVLALAGLVADRPIAALAARLKPRPRIIVVECRPAAAAPAVLDAVFRDSRAPALIEIDDRRPDGPAVLRLQTAGIDDGDLQRWLAALAGHPGVARVSVRTR